MAKLSDLINVNINRETIDIQGVEFPIIFSFIAFPYIEEAYGKEYTDFEREMREMLEDEKGLRMGRKEIRLMRVLIYAMLRAGGTETTMEELEGAIPVPDLPGIFQKALDIFSRQQAQKEDMERIKTEKK